MAVPDPQQREISVTSSPDHDKRKDWVALLLALGVATALNGVVIAVFLQAVINNTPISENATQVLSGVFGGALGILGSFLGFRAGTSAGERTTTASIGRDQQLQTFSGPTEPPPDV